MPLTGALLLAAALPAAGALPLAGALPVAGARPLPVAGELRRAGATVPDPARSHPLPAARVQAGGVPADTVPSAGVSRALARERAARVSQLAYAVRLSIPAAPAEPLPGEVTMRFRLADASSPLALDFQQDSAAVAAVAVNGRPAAYVVARGHIQLPAAALRAGDNVVQVRFRAGDAALNRNPEYLYSLFVPARASTALPVFDQPDLKARFTLTLELPAAWRAVANGAVRARSMRGDRQTIRFAPTRPIPTYLFGFAAGKWSVETAVRGGRTLHMYHRETDAAKLARNRDSIFDLAARSIAYMERYTGIPYPFDKFDIVLVPSFQFGGMEHPGEILFNASTLLLDRTATENQRLNRASTIAHETAHMWFGDLVTMRWFDDVWMKEVFANFMAAKIMDPLFPRIDHELRFLLAHYPSAYAVDRSAGTHPIRQPLENLAEAGQLYDAIIYDKAPIVMRMLEQLVGGEHFRRGVNEYLRAHAYGNAEWPDLISVLDRLAPGRRLPEWSRVWIDEAGRPIIRVAVATRPTGALAGITLLQADPAGRERIWSQPASIALVYGDSARRLPLFLDAPATTVPAAAGLPAPDFVLPNGGGRAYGLMVLDPGRRGALLRALPALRPAMVRAAAWLDAWDALLERQVEPGDFMEVALGGLERETDEQLAQRLLAYTQDAFWHFLTPAQRAALAPRLEQRLWSRLAAARTTSLRAAFFATLRATALTPPSLARLTRIWARADSVPGLPLSEQDYTTLGLELAVRDLPSADSILATQQERVHDPDRKARLAFVRPALSADSAVRGAWFRSLADAANRRHEPWVLEGLAWMNHPLRQQASEPYILPALELLEEVRRTGDIFFPARWVTAVLSGHSTPSAAGIVLGFLSSRPQYPERLRRIVLQGADELLRAAGARGALAP